LPVAVLRRITLARSADHLRQVLTERRHTSQRVLVAEDHVGTVLGFSTSGPRYEREHGFHLPRPFRGEVFELYLHPAHQRRGTGRALLTHTIWDLLGIGLHPVLVWVLASNPARFFYEACGGTPVARAPVTVGNFTTQRIAYGWSKTLPILCGLPTTAR
jgi:GNAT superfamily N-acetyltransferase